MELIKELPLNEVGKYINLSNNVLSARVVIDRTHEVIIRFTPEYFINQINELLKETVWLKYERKTLEMLKKLLGNIKEKNKLRFTKIKIDDFMKFARYAFEASIERASWVKDKIVNSSLKNDYNKYTSMILFMLNQNIELLRKIKEIEPKDENELLIEVKKIIKVGPRIQESILDTYTLILDKKEEEIAEEIFNKTLWCIDNYSNFDEI